MMGYWGNQLWGWNTGMQWTLWTLPVFILGFAFWIWMLVDMLKRKMDDKLVWAVVLVFLNFIGAVLYFFLVYSKKKRR